MKKQSATIDCPIPKKDLPTHVAIIMDGNGRWANQRALPRVEGHRIGVESVRSVVEFCVAHGIQCLSLFAFSSENWNRPRQEVDYLLSLFSRVLRKEVEKLNENNIRLHIIGDRTSLGTPLRNLIEKAETQTQNNQGLKLVIALNYGGRWDLTAALKQMASEIKEGRLALDAVTPDTITSYLALPKDIPDPDLFIRTSGELRLSNFFLWQLAYTELYFTETLWPDFRQPQFLIALEHFAKRQRRFGYTSEQLQVFQNA